ncbi:unnamed protein product, partial [Chrysoparadoxa australica]
FVPYENSFTGRYGEPSSLLTRERVNEGAPNTPSYPRMLEGTNPRQICPGMVGPLQDGLFYCTSKNHGYCDKRSGSCMCNTGYSGLSCESCQPTHYQEGGLCFPKLLCPNECSAAGECHHDTGTCECQRHRLGLDCSEPRCQGFDPLCTECTDTGCVKCLAGYSVSGTGNCIDCSQHDPRCSACNENECLECIDLLLTGARRSGARDTDAALPVDEQVRELAHKLEFGSVSPLYFTDAEHYKLLPRERRSLRQDAKKCDQGITGTIAWTCSAIATSHVVCGHEGTITFASPEYEVHESGKNVRITVRRSGGGYGKATVQYGIRHVTTTSSDVTPHAQYTGSTEVVFDEGVIELSFLVTIHDDGEQEGDEAFDLYLYAPRHGAVLGPQSQTRLLLPSPMISQLQHALQPIPAMPFPRVSSYIYDSGPQLESPSFEVTPKLDLQLIPPTLGAPASITISAADAEGGAILAGATKDLFHHSPDIPFLYEPYPNVMITSWLVIIRPAPFELEEHSILGPSEVCPCLLIQVLVDDNGDGTYTAEYAVEESGSFELHVTHAHQGGLLASYYSDAFMEELSTSRVDATVDWNWSEHAVAGAAADYLSISWSGRVEAPISEVFEFQLEADAGAAAEFWLNGQCALGGAERKIQPDSSPQGEGTNTAAVWLEEGSMNSVMINYWHTSGDAHIVWASATSASIPQEVVPSDSLYSMRHVQGSPINLDVVSAPTNAAWSDVYGLGLHEADVAVESSFQVVARDAFGNLRGEASQADGDKFSCLLTLQAERGKERTSIAIGADAGTGSVGVREVACSTSFDSVTDLHRLGYVPFRSGTHQLRVFHQGIAREEPAELLGSPFTVMVAPAAAFAPRCEASGSLLGGSSIAGDDAIILLTPLAQVTARDLYNNQLLHGGADFRAVMLSLTGGDATRAAVTDNQDGSYTISMAPSVAGSNELHLTLGARHIASSPYPVTITPAAAYASSSFTFGDGLLNPVATVPNTFYVSS